MAKTFKVEFVRLGRSFECGEDTLVLDAAQAAGLDVPFNCQGGTCRSCAVKIISGEIDQEEALALTPAELAEGWRLTCIGRPKSDLSFDA